MRSSVTVHGQHKMFSAHAVHAAKVLYMLIKRFWSAVYDSLGYEVYQFFQSFQSQGCLFTL